MRLLFAGYLSNSLFTLLFAYIVLFIHFWLVLWLEISVEVEAESITTLWTIDLLNNLIFSIFS